MKKLLWGVPILALLAGCAPEGAPVGDPAPIPTVTITAAPETVEGPDYGFTFFEQAQLGSTWAEMSDQLHYPVAGIEECPYYGLLWGTELTNTFAYTDSRDPDSGAQLFYTMRFLGADDDAYPRNAEGVGVGSTEAEVLAAFPDATVAVVNDLGAGEITVITVEDPDSESRYAYGISTESAVVDLLQWGLNAGGQWSHLCGGF